jgi:hypothetical protein
MGHERSFPPGVREQFEDLTNQVINLYQKWRFYLDLFDNKDAEEVINDRLSGSFRIIEESVRHDLIITLYRLADVAETHGGRRTNLTLRSLLDQVRGHAFEEFVADCERQLDALDTHLAPLRERRNRTVGHNDRETALGTRTVLPLSRAHIEDSAAAIAEFMNRVAMHFDVSPTAYEYSHPIGGGQDLIEVVRRGWQHEADEDLKWGITPPVRWRPRIGS